MLKRTIVVAAPQHRTVNPRSLASFRGACLFGALVALAGCKSTIALRACPSPQELCAGVCVDVTTDPVNCGACASPCFAPDGGAAVCTAGACADFSCPAPEVHCPGVDDRCVDAASDPAHCGACDKACPALNGGSAACSGGKCGIACASPLVAVGGACVDPASDASNCGAAGHACVSPEGGAAGCAGGKCAGACPQGASLCGGTGDGGGKCLDVSRDPANCGACGHACGAPEGGSAACVGGVCAGTCGSSKAVCGAGVDGGGTCADLATDAKNCAACGHACAAPEGGAAGCVASACAGQCSGSRTVCAQTIDGGGSCKDLSSDPAYCGACDKACPSPAGGVATCNGGACGASCGGSSFAACSNACTDLRNDAANCNACGNACGAPAGGVPWCAGGVCVGACTGGSSVCGLSTTSSGACTALATDPQNCGACGHGCPGPIGGLAGCAGGACTATCTPGQSVCGATSTSGGACTALATDPQNCGACGHGCDAQQGYSVSCISGTCAYTAHPPSPPASLTAVAGNAQVTLTWPASSGATAYNVYWASTSGVTKANGTLIAGVATGYVHAGLTNGAAYYYVVTALLGTAESAPSPQAQATPAVVDAWATRASMPGAKTRATYGVVNNILYVTAGGNDVTTYAYDPVANSWSTKASIPVSGMEVLGASGVLNGLIYAAGGAAGFDGHRPMNTVLAYDPSADAWSTKASMPRSLAGVSLGVVAGKLYAVGGVDQICGCTPQSEVDVYDPSHDTWVASGAASLPTAKVSNTVVTAGGLMYSFGGATTWNAGSNPLSTTDVYAYNPLSPNAWTTKAAMPRARLGATAGVLNGKVYLAGGVDASNADVGPTDVYDPASDTWASPPKASILTPGNYVAGGVMNGLFYVAGGDNSAGPLRVLEVYGTSN